MVDLEKTFLQKAKKSCSCKFLWHLSKAICHYEFNTVIEDHCPVRLGSTKKRMLLKEEIGIEKSIERISGIRTIQNGGRGIN